MSKRYPITEARAARFSDVYRVFLKHHAMREIGLEQNHFDAARKGESGRKVSM